MTQDRSTATLEGLARARSLGRKPGRKPKVSDAKVRAAIPLGTAEGARKAGLSKSQFIARRRALEAGENNDGWTQDDTDTPATLGTPS